MTSYCPDGYDINLTLHPLALTMKQLDRKVAGKRSFHDFEGWKGTEGANPVVHG